MSSPRRRRIPPLKTYHFFPWHWFVNGLLGSPVVPRRYVGRLLKLAGFDIRGRVLIRPGVFFTCPNVTMEDETIIEAGAQLVAQGGITFKARSGISYGTQLLTQTHDIEGPLRRWSHAVRTEPIVIGEGVWIGAGVIVLPGVTIGDGCVVAAGAVVGKDCAPHGLYFGNPARRIQDLPMEWPPPEAADAAADAADQAGAASSATS